jgi:hypothetical protein
MTYYSFTGNEKSLEFIRHNRTPVNKIWYSKHQEIWFAELLYEQDVVELKKLFVNVTEVDYANTPGGTVDVKFAHKYHAIIK